MADEMIMRGTQKLFEFLPNETLIEIADTWKIEVLSDNNDNKPYLVSNLDNRCCCSMLRYKVIVFIEIILIGGQASAEDV